MVEHSNSRRQPNRQMERYRRPGLTIARFVARRVLLGALIFGVFAAAESLGQAYGIVAAYPHEAQRQKVIEGLASSPALGIFYGDAHAAIVTPTGYMVYRIGPILALVGAIWGFMFMNKWLRGQEEDGRWELLLAARTTAARATMYTVLGGSAGLVLVYLLSLFIVGLGSASEKIGGSFGGGVLFAFGIAAPVAFGMATGAVASQLGATKRRANMYAVGFIAICFALRSIGNIAPHLAWLKNFTPFGWVEKLHPFTTPSAVWLLPLLALIAFGFGLACQLARTRNLGESLIKDHDQARPRLSLLDPAFGFAWRMNRGVLSIWLVSALLFCGVVTGIAKTVAKSLDDSGSLTSTFGKLSGNPTASFEMTYISIGSYLVAVLIMFMVTTGLGAIREEEASGRLDNFVSGTLPRVRWLLGRLVVLVGAAVAICLLTGICVWVFATLQQISVSVPKLIFGGLNVLGPVLLLLGGGILVYGVAPRIAVWIMYAWVAWSFTADVLASVVKLSKTLVDTSLFHYITFVPASDPDWGTVARLVVIGCVLAACGLAVFHRRDLVTE